MIRKEMKRSTFIILAIAIIAGILFFALMAIKNSSKENAVSPKQISANLNRNFDAKATIKMHELLLTADVNRTDIGKYTIKIDEPSSLAGMVIQYDGENVSTSFHGINLNVDADSLLSSSLGKMLINSIDKASAQTGVSISSKDNVICIQGENPDKDGKFNLIMDREKGSILSISSAETDFNCNFTAFSFLN